MDFSFLKEEWFWAMTQAVIVTITLYFIYHQLKIQSAGHIVNTLTIIDNRWNSESMLIARNTHCSDWKQNNREFDAVSIYIANFLEELATYAEIKAVPDKIMWEMGSNDIEHYYNMFVIGIEKYKKEMNDEFYYTGFKKLYEKMQNISKDELRKIKNKDCEVTFDDNKLTAFANKEIILTAKLLKQYELNNQR